MEPRRFSRALHKIKAASDLSGVDRVVKLVMGGSPMSRASGLATSTMKTDAPTVCKAFVTLRFAGDDLDPRDISAVLPVTPTRAHRKDEEFVAGQHAGKLHGRTGIWFLATDKLVHSDDLGDHLRFVHDLLYSAPTDDSRITKLRDILGCAHSRAASPASGTAIPEKPPRKSPTGSSRQ
jgi:hypothetical protein